MVTDTVYLGHLHDEGKEFAKVALEKRKAQSDHETLRMLVVMWGATGT